LKDREEFQVYAELASLQIVDIRAGEAMLDRLSLLRSKLRRAETHIESGERLEAQELWRGIIRLYSDNSELDDVVAFAQGRLDGKQVEELAFSLKSGSEEEMQNKK
jgi:hypothetical protein